MTSCLVAFSRYLLAGSFRLCYSNNNLNKDSISFCNEVLLIAPTHFMSRHTALREQVHEDVRQFEQVAGHMYGQAGGVVGVSL